MTSQLYLTEYPVYWSNVDMSKLKNIYAAPAVGSRLSAQPPFMKAALQFPHFNRGIQMNSGTQMKLAR